MPRKRREPRPARQEEPPRPWCTACGGPVIWPGPPEHCLMCGCLDISRQPVRDDDPRWPPDVIADSREFVEAVHEFDRRMAAKRAAEGGSS